MKQRYFKYICKVILLVILIGLLISGCTKQNDAESKISVHRDNAVTLAAYRHLAPGNKDAVYCSKILGVWEPLITRDEAGFPKGALAESWEMKNGGKEWTFHLRRNVRFSNGTPLTADCVIKNFARMQLGYKLSSFYGMDINVYYPSLLKYEKLDDYTFKLIFAEANINQLYKMMDFGSPVFEPSCFAEDGNFKSTVIGTGPYKIEENILHKYVRLVRNDDYYGPKAKINEFIIRTIPNADVRYAALKSGEIDGVLDINAMPPFLADELQKDDRYAVSANKSSMIRFLHLNGSRFPFNDVRMRQAVSLAVDRQSLVKALYLNYAVPTSNIVNYTSPYYADYKAEYNLEKAKALAKEVLGEKRVKVTYCINGSEIMQKGEAELIAYWLREIGLDVTIQSLEYATMSKMLRKGEYDIARVQQGLANGDPYGIFYTFMMPDGSRNVSSSSKYFNKEVIDLMNLVKHTADEEERRKIYNRLQQISVEEQPIVPLFNDKNIVAYSKRLQNYRALIYGINLAEIELVD